MIFEQLIYNDLGCASYLIGCQGTGEASVVDPALDTRPLERALEYHDARLIGVIETHTHADHISGHGILALEQGVPIYVSSLAGVDHPHTPLKDGDSIKLGNIEIVAMHTPGHRPEHLALQVIDHTRAEADVQRILDLSTGVFREDFQRSADDFIKTAVDSKAVTTGTVNAAALDTLEGDSGVVMVAATSEVTNTNGANQDPRPFRISVTVTRDGGTPKMSDVEFVP
jgi:hypothetical protein